MSARAANPARGEAAIMVAGETLTLRPSFEALVAAEAELGPLFALVERASEGRLTLAETAALFHHCAGGRTSRERIGGALAEIGLAGAAPVVRILLGQILQGRVSEAAARLAGLAGAVLGWRPDEFWSATPMELAAVLAARVGEESPAATADDLARLKEMFPDG